MAVVKFSPYNPNTAKPVESLLFPCLDEGSTPSSSTKKGAFFGAFFRGAGGSLWPCLSSPFGERQLGKNIFPTVSGVQNQHCCTPPRQYDSRGVQSRVFHTPVYHSLSRGVQNGPFCSRQVVPALCGVWFGPSCTPPPFHCSRGVWFGLFHTLKAISTVGRVQFGSSCIRQAICLPMTCILMFPSTNFPLSLNPL